VLLRPRPQCVDHLFFGGTTDRLFMSWVKRYPPLGLLQSAAFLERAGHAVRVLDAEAYWMDRATAARALAGFRPDILIGSLNIYNPGADNEFCRDVALRLGARYIARGHFVRDYPDVAARLPGVEFGLTGRGHASAVDLVAALSDGNDADSVPGVVFTRDGEVVRTPAEPPIPLDDWPFPARHLVDNNNYSSILARRHPFTTALGSVGCTHRCNYCVDALIPYMAAGPERIADELADCVNRFGIREVNFLDPMFNITRERAALVAEQFLRRDLRITWSFKARADQLDGRLARLLARAGCSRVHIGIESGNAETLRLMRRNVDVDAVRGAVDACRGAGLFVLGYFQVGYDGENPGAVDDTLDIAESLELDFIEIGETLPLPGTEVHRALLRGGKPDPWLHFLRNDPVGADTFLVLNPGRSRKELEFLKRRILRRFFLRTGFFRRTMTVPEARRVIGTLSSLARINLKAAIVRTFFPAAACAALR